MFELLAFLSLAQSSVATNPEGVQNRPDVAPARVIATPDWSDSRLYPMTARIKNEEGSLRAELLIDPGGVPKACRILMSSNFNDLDTSACQLMMQMRFEPARDSSGAPLQSSYARDVIWLLADARPFASSTLKVRESISGGRQTSCDVLGGEGPYVAAWTALACPLLRDVPYYFGAHSDHSASASIEFRLDARDGALLLKRPWDARPLIAAEKLSFVVNGEGDPTMCTPLESEGFGPRSENATSPCPDLLTLLWFSPPQAGAPPRKGTFETRVYLTGEDADR